MQFDSPNNWFPSNVGSVEQSTELISVELNETDFRFIHITNEGRKIWIDPFFDSVRMTKMQKLTLLPPPQQNNKQKNWKKKIDEF